MLCTTILRHVAQTSDFFAERRKMDWNWSIRMSPVLCQNRYFFQPFDGMRLNLQTFSQNAEKWTEIDQCEWDQYLAKTYALCNHFTACGPNLRLFRRKAKNGLKLIYPNESCTLPKPILFPTIWRHEAQPTDFFAECRKMDWNRSMRMRPIFSKNVCFVQPFYGMWPKLKTLSQRGEKWNSIGVQYLAETYTLYNHFTVCSPNFRLFRRMAKTGLKSISADESYILPEPMLCATFLRHVAQTTDSLARKAKYGLSLIYGNESNI